jgi:multicomponent Na+:H+ antiporter subunit E
MRLSNLRPLFWRLLLLPPLALIIAEGLASGWFIAIAVLLALLGSLAIANRVSHPLVSSGILPFLLFFLRNSIIAGSQVALIALRPKLDLQPATLRLPLRLPAGPPQVVLVTTIGLMPGTVSIKLGNDHLLIHLLDQRQIGVVEGIEALQSQIGHLFGIEISNNETFAEIAG